MEKEIIIKEVEGKISVSVRGFTYNEAVGVFLVLAELLVSHIASSVEGGLFNVEYSKSV